MSQLIVAPAVKENKELGVEVGSLIYVSGYPDFPILLTQENPDNFLGVKLATGFIEICTVTKASLREHNYSRWKGKITFTEE